MERFTGGEFLHPPTGPPDDGDWQSAPTQSDNNQIETPKFLFDKIFWHFQFYLYFSIFFREGKFEIPPLIWYDRERDEREHNGDTGVCTRCLIRASSMMIKSSRKKQKKNAQLRQTEETNEKTVRLAIESKFETQKRMLYKYTIRLSVFFSPDLSNVL